MIDELLKIPPFSLDRKEKNELLTERLLSLTETHINCCPEYSAMIRGVGFNLEKCQNYYSIPFLPVSLFKEFDLKSIPPEEVFKTMTSSGTTGQAVSKIYLDKHTASIQQKVLVKIVSEFIGSSRLPMLIIDSSSMIKNREMFSARGAGILGFSIFGSEKAYALNDNMELDLPVVEAFLNKHKGKRILIFGFTYIMWLHFYKQLMNHMYKLDLQNCILFHGGGWKKLESESVEKAGFKQRLTDICGLSDIHDYYGMVEQTGCIYAECEYGYLHASIFSDIITRRHIDFSTCSFGEAGIVQVVSTLAESYPGHSLLTEDEGVIIGEDDCACGRKGKYFHINGRLKMAEIRGCSDTYAVSR